MQRTVFALMALAWLTACGDPLGGIERLNDVTVAEVDANAALPDPSETSDDTPILGQLIDEARAPEDPSAATSVDAEPEPQAQGGFLGGLLRRMSGAEPVDEATLASSANDGIGPIDGLESDSPGTPASAPAEQVASAPSDVAVPDVGTVEPAAHGAATASAEVPGAAAPVRRGGFLGLFGNRDRSDDGAVRTASLTPGPGSTAPARRNTDALALRDVTYGTQVPFGEIARTCDAKRQPLGRKMDRGPGNTGFTLYDSDPDFLGLRTWYITGFDDGCPRQFSAALAVFGAPSLHEQLRYAVGEGRGPYTDTDRAYDRIKRDICGKSRRQPCGARIDRLERNTVFVSIYDRFEGSERWTDVLLHDGQVMAATLKAN